MSVRGTGKRSKQVKAAALPEVESAPAAAAPGPRTIPSVASVLACLNGPRLLDLCRLLGCEVRDISGGRDRLAQKLAHHMNGRMRAALNELGRDELRAVCRRHGVDASARAR